MKMRTLFRPKIILALLLATIAMNVFSVYFFARLDQVVHGDLYRYGLQFSYEWATQYWTYTRLMLGLLGFATATTAISIVLILAGKPTHKIQLLPRARTIFKIDPTKLICSVLFSAGVIALAFSIYYTSSILAFIGLGLIFWGALFFYVNPSKHVPLELLNATAITALTNIEKIITDSNVNGKGIYLPPKYLKDFESSLIFIPLKAQQALPKPEEVEEEKLYSKNPDGILLTPPGLALSKLFEKELGTSFTKTDLDTLQEKLPKLLIEDMEIVEGIDVETENNTIAIEIRNHIFKEVCEETRKHQKIYESIGCPLCSAVACALAKATGKPVTIEREEQSQDGKTTKIQYNILEE